MNKVNSSTHPGDFASLKVPDKRAYAEAYARRLGMSAFPVVGKVPPAGMDWKYLAQSRTIAANGWRDATGYALAPIVGSRRAVLDIDAHDFWLAALEKIPALRNAFTVARGDHRHIYVELARPLPGASIALTQGRDEIASLRGYGAYVIGPESDHPESGQSYQHISGQHPAQLNEAETDALIALLTPPPTPAPQSDIIAIASAPGAADPGYLRLLDDVIARLKARGYRPHGNWINGHCPFEANHADGDRHPSFGVNVVTGVGHCFNPACGDHNLFEIADALDIAAPKPAAGRFTFASNPAAPNQSESEDHDHERTIATEINITVELFRRRRAAAAMLFDCLADDSRRNYGKRTYEYMELVDAGKGIGLSRTQVTKNLRILVDLGLMEKIDTGLYDRVSIERAKAALGITAAYAEARIKVSQYQSLRVYKRAIMTTVGAALPKRQAANRVAKSTGMSRATLYRHERGHVERHTTTRRSAPAATGTDFIKVFDSRNRHVTTTSNRDAFGAMERAIREGGRAFGWTQLPSLRTYGGKAEM